MTGFYIYLGIMTLMLGLSLYIMKFLARKRCTEVVKGTVVYVCITGFRESEIEYEYNYKDTPFRVRFKYYSTHKFYSAGEEVDVHFDPFEPKYSYIDSTEYQLAYVMLAIGCMAFAMSLIEMFLMR